jgi:hypothetical protein
MGAFHELGSIGVRIRLPPSVAIHEKKAPLVAEPSQRLIPLYLSPGADAEYNACNTCAGYFGHCTCGDNVSVHYG